MLAVSSIMLSDSDQEFDAWVRLTETLNSKGYRVLSVTSVEQALTILQTVPLQAIFIDFCLVSYHNIEPIKFLFFIFNYIIIHRKLKMIEIFWRHATILSMLIIGNDQLITMSWYLEYPSML